MNQKMIERVKKVLSASDVKIVERLLGGMSNYTFVVEADRKKYTFRIPGNYSEYFVDRNIEKKNIALVETLGITNETVYLDVEDGVKIARYVDGVSLNLMKQAEYPLEKISTALKKIHQSGVVSENDYAPFARLEKYEQYIKEMGFTHPDDYLHLKKQFYQLKNRLEQVEKVFCHGDSQPSNFIVSGDTIYIVDFEFSGNNDPIYDLACFGNLKVEDAVKLLEQYYDGQVDQDKLFRLYAWRTFQCFQWFNVAIFKHLKGMSEELHIDFLAVSNHYLHMIEVLYAEIIKFM